MATILVADDVPQLRRLLRMALDADGHTVVEAVDGDEAWAMLGHYRPDIAVLDVNMPGRSGLELCRAVRADSCLARLPLVVVSANGLEDDVRDAHAAGADLFLAKPFSPARVANAINQLAGHTARRSVA